MHTNTTSPAVKSSPLLYCKSRGTKLVKVHEKRQSNITFNEYLQKSSWMYMSPLLCRLWDKNFSRPFLFSDTFFYRCTQFITAYLKCKQVKSFIYLEKSVFIYPRYERVLLIILRKNCWSLGLKIYLQHTSSYTLIWHTREWFHTYQGGDWFYFFWPLHKIMEMLQ